MKDLTKENKVQILIAGLEERYQAMRTIRDRVQSIGIWALGLMLAAGGWLIQSQTSLTLVQKVLYALGVVGALYALRKYLGDLRIGFNGQQRVAARLEKSLGFFTAGVFDEEKDSVYPAQWEKAGTAQGDGKFFDTTYLLLYAGAIFLIAVILFSNVSFQGHFLRFRHQGHPFWSPGREWRGPENREQKENIMLQPQSP